MSFLRAVGEEQVLTVVRPKGTEPKIAVGPHKVYEWPELKRRTKDLILQLGIQQGGSTRALTAEERDLVDGLAESWVENAGTELASICGQEDGPLQEIKLVKEDMHKNLEERAQEGGL